MKIVASERTPVLADDSSLVQFKGRGNRGEYLDLVPALGVAATTDSGEGRVGSERGIEESQQSLSRAERDWITSESRFFLVQACADRQDRLARYAMAVLRMMVEGEGHL
jgi:hypothetical protein